MVFPASFGCSARSDQRVSESVSEPAMGSVPVSRESMSGFPVCVRGPVRSVEGVSEAFPGGRASRFRESLRVLPTSFGGPARSDQGVSEAVSEPAMVALFPFRGSP